MVLTVKNRDGSTSVIGRRPRPGGGYTTAPIGEIDKKTGKITKEIKGSIRPGETIAEGKVRQGIPLNGASKQTNPVEATASPTSPVASTGITSGTTTGNRFIGADELAAADPNLVASTKNQYTYVTQQGNKAYAVASYETTKETQKAGGIQYIEAPSKKGVVEYVPVKDVKKYEREQNAKNISIFGLETKYKEPSYEEKNILNPINPVQGIQILGKGLQKGANISREYAYAEDTLTGKIPVVGTIGRATTEATISVGKTLEERPVGTIIETGIGYGVSYGLHRAGGFVLSKTEPLFPTATKAGVLVGETALVAGGVASTLKKTPEGIKFKTATEIGEEIPVGLAIGYGGLKGFRDSPVSPYLVPSANEIVKSKVPRIGVEKVAFKEVSGGEITGVDETTVVGFKIGTKGTAIASYDNTGLRIGKQKVSQGFAEKLLSAEEGSGYELSEAIGTSALERAGIMVGNTQPLAQARLMETPLVVKDIYKETGKIRSEIKGRATKTEYLTEKELPAVYATAKNRKDIVFGSLSRESYGVVRPDKSSPGDFDIFANRLATEAAAEGAAGEYISNLKSIGVKNVRLGEKSGTIERFVSKEGYVKIGEIKGAPPSPDEIDIDPNLYTAGFTKAFPVRQIEPNLRITDLPQETRNLGSNVLTLQRTSTGADYVPFPKRAKDVTSFYQSAKTLEAQSSGNARLSSATKRFKELYGEMISGSKRISVSASSYATPKSSSFNFVPSPNAFTSLSLSPRSITSPSISFSPSFSVSSSLSRSPSVSPSPSLSPSFSVSSSLSRSPSVSPSPSLSPSFSVSSSVSPSPSISPSPGSPINSLLSGVPTIGGGAGFGFGFKKYSKRRKSDVYIPSFTAAAFNIKSQRKQSASGFTGFEVRPIEFLRKKQKRK